MGKVSMEQSRTNPLETVLQRELARETRALKGVAPVISHMLEASGQSLVSEAIVARLRGMLHGLARQMLEAAGRAQPFDAADQQDNDTLAGHLAGESALLHHLYALAMEGHLTERLDARSSVDPVLSPMLQELIASDQPAVAELAMSTLAAQSRFVQGQRRMALSMGELPAPIFLLTLDVAVGAQDCLTQQEAAEMSRQLKRDYDEGAGRLALLARLTTAMRGAAVAALELDHAGLALFASGMSALTRQPRELAVLACHPQQGARLALILRAAGQSVEAIERQFMLIEPAERLPQGIASLSVARAQKLLQNGAIADSQPRSVL